MTKNHSDKNESCPTPDYTDNYFRLNEKERWFFILTGVIIGVGASLLSYFGNPANTGICVSCFLENLAGSLGLHGNFRMEYARPEIIGFVLGSFLGSAGSGGFRAGFRATGGSSPLLKFFIGIFLIVGCAVFIGCPIKMIIRLAAGDFTALAGVAGMMAGVWIGLKFLEGGFRLGRSAPMPIANGLLVPALMFAILVGLLFGAPFIKTSTEGPAAMHAPLWLSLVAGLVIGGFAGKTGFCITGGTARIFLWGPKEVKGCPKSTGLLMAIGAFLVSAFVANLLTGQFHPGIHAQPSANGDYFWNAMGMVLVGFGSVLIRGCPFRQLILSGQGDTDAGAAVLGMIVGAALVVDWGIEGTPEGTPLAGKIAVLVGLIFLFVVGMAYRQRGMGIAPEYQAGLD